MKHLCALLLLAVFLYNLVGVYPVAMWQQHALRQQAESRRHAALPDAALVRLAVARGSRAVQWREQHEFAYRGQLYDVVRQHAKADSVVYYCWPDRGEEKLLAGLAEHVREYAHPDAGARKSAKKAFDYLSKISCLLPAPVRPGRISSCPAPPTYPEYRVGLRLRPQAAPFTPPRTGYPVTGRRA